MRNRFDRELELLGSELIEMGALVEDAINAAARALVQRDRELAQSVLHADDEVDGKERGIERRCLRLLLRQQPVAADLRLVSTALKMVTDLERIGDQAEDIAEITVRLCGEPRALSPAHIPQMAEYATRMVTRAVDAFVARDLGLARAVIACDDVIDDLFVRVRDDLVELIRADAENGGQAIDLIMIAKYFERIGDHAANIGEWVVFSITGEHKSERVL